MTHQRRQFHNEYVLGKPVSDHSDGAEGQVFLCSKKDLDGHACGERFAVKIFKFRDKAAHLKMKKQVTAMEATGHFNILKTYDHFDEEDDGTFYVVNELARGGELFDHCVSVNGNGPMPEQGLQLAIRQLLRGLAHAHLRGIVHLDLKMENILLKNEVNRADWHNAIDSPDAPIQLKIMDYGFCEFNIGVDNMRWAGRIAPGTEGYRAPEVILQLRELTGARITTASDLFSLGCILYVMATGVPAFRCIAPSCKSSGQGCVCNGISNKLIALSQGRPEGQWIPLSDPRLKHAQGYSPLLQDLMARLLHPDPVARISASEALLHPWVRGQVCGPLSPAISPSLGESKVRSDSFVEEGPIRLKKADKTPARYFEFEAFAGATRASGASNCAAAVAKIRALRMKVGAGEGAGDVDALADSEHQLVDFILSDDAETCRLALISLTSQMASLQNACDFVKRLHVFQNLQLVFIGFYQKVRGKMPKLLELLEVLADHRDPRILEELLQHKELIDFVILNADSRHPPRIHRKAQRVIVRCVQAADLASDSLSVSRVLRAFSPFKLSCAFSPPFFLAKSDSVFPLQTFRRSVIFSSDDSNAANVQALGFELGRPYHIVNGTILKQDGCEMQSFSFQLASEPGGSSIVPLTNSSRRDIEMFLHVADPFTHQPQQRSAIQFIVDLLCQCDTIESEFLFINYHQDIVVGLFESLFKAAMTHEFFDDIVGSNSVLTVLKLLQRRLCPVVPSASAAALTPEEQTAIAAQITKSRLGASIGPWAISTPRCEYALRFISTVMNEASRRQRHDAFYAGAAADAAAAFTSPSNYFHSLLKEVLDIYEAVASEELLHDVLKVVLDVKSCAAAFPQVH